MKDEAAYLADDVSVGMVARWINDAHMEASRETPPNMDYMREMQRTGEAVQSALNAYRRATKPLNDPARPEINLNKH